MVHGGGRDADGYFRAGLAAAFLAGALENTALVSPRFPANNADCRGSLESNEVNWDCGADHAGAWLAVKDRFPNLKAIVVCGFSGGGQYVSRYAMAASARQLPGLRLWPYGFQARAGYSAKLTNER